MTRWNLTIGGPTTHAGLHIGGAALALAALAAFYYFAYAPLQRDVTQRTERIAQVQTLARKADAVAASHRQIVDRLEELTRMAVAVRRRIPTDASASEFVDQAGRLAADWGLEVQQCQSEPPEHHEGFSTIDVSCQLVGSYASICQYLVAIDQLPQISQVRRLDITHSTGAGGYPVEVIFQLYYQVDPNDKDRQRGTL